jgi:hypothetical protein
VASTYVNNLRLEEMATGEKSGTWGNITNTNLELVGQALGYGTRAIANASTDNITIADGTSDADRSMYLKLTGGGQACTVTLLPNTSSKMWIMENATSYTLTFTQGSGANVAIKAGQTKMIFADGLGSGAVVYELGTVAVQNIQADGTVTVGIDDTGYDVTFFGATTGKKLFWDESEDTLNVAGTTALAGNLSVTGVTSNADGSNSAPAITNTGDTDTGLYFSADNEISTATAGEQRIILDSAGLLKPREASSYGGEGAVIQGAVVFAGEMPYVASVADNTWVQISMSTPTYENKAVVDGTTTSNAITIKKAGRYLCIWNGTLGGGSSYGNGTYYVRAYVEKNSVSFGGGTALFTQGANTSGTPAGNGITQYASSARGGTVSGIDTLSVSDVIRFWQLHDHTGGGYADPGNVVLIYFDE